MLLWCPPAAFFLCLLFSPSATLVSFQWVWDQRKVFCLSNVFPHTQCRRINEVAWEKSVRFHQHSCRIFICGQVLWVYKWSESIWFSFPTLNSATNEAHHQWRCRQQAARVQGLLWERFNFLFIRVSRDRSIGHTMEIAGPHQGFCSPRGLCGCCPGGGLTCQGSWARGGACMCPCTHNASPGCAVALLPLPVGCKAAGEQRAARTVAGKGEEELGAWSLISA